MAKAKLAKFSSLTTVIRVIVCCSSGAIGVAVSNLSSARGRAPEAAMWPHLLHRMTA